MIPTLMLLAGLSVSANLGETSPGAMLRAAVSGDRWEVQGRFDTADKVGGAGWLAQGVAQAVLGPGLLVGVEGGVRDGGAWRKTAVGVRAGWVWAGPRGSLQAVCRATWTRVLSESGVWAHLEYRRTLGRGWVWAAEYDAGGYRQDGWHPGVVVTTSVGWRRG